jgi:hypothetical protein
VRLARAVEPGREDVPDEERLLVAHGVLDGVEHEVGSGNSDVLRLRPWHIAEEGAVPEDSLIGAAAEETTFAVPALAARDRERADNAISLGKTPHAAVNGLDDTDELVPQDPARAHPRDAAVDHMEIAAADRRLGHPYQRVTRLLDAGFRHVDELDHAEVFECQRLHRQPPRRVVISALLLQPLDAE